MFKAELEQVHTQQLITKRLYDYFHSASLDPQMDAEEQTIALEMILAIQSFQEILEALQLEWEAIPTNQELINALRETFEVVRTQALEIVEQLQESGINI